MKIRILKFRGMPPQDRPERIEPEIGPDSGWADAGGLPAAYVVRVRDLALLRRFNTRTVDRGVKHKAKGLSRLLLGHDKIPLIDGDFTDAGQLRRSIRTLLVNATKRRERNLYVVGVEEAVFTTVWEQAGAPGGGRVEAGGAKALGVDTQPAVAMISGSGHSRDADHSAGGANRSWQLFNMLDYCEVPPALAERYRGESRDARLVRQLILRAADIDARILILGETGTGKDVVARAIHDFGKRAGEKFIAVNCSGIPHDLLESELFGHEKGSFTGATHRKIGLWEAANRGTLFLDEIGDLSPEHQAKILRALEEKEIRRVGGKEALPVDVRIVAATNRDLYSMVLSGQFREDLYYRLREFLIRTPPLRDHPEEIPLLASHFWRRIAGDGFKALPAEILEELAFYGWMGNVRELKTVLTNLHGLFGTDKLSVERLRAVMEFYGRGPALREEGAPSRDFGKKRMENLRHLRRTEEAIGSCAAVLQPVTAGSRADRHAAAAVQAALRLRLHELEMLCVNPLLFQNESLFSLVYLFKGKLAYLHGLLQNGGDDAAAFWESDGAEMLYRVRSAISAQIKDLLPAGAWETHPGAAPA